MKRHQLSKTVSPVTRLFQIPVFGVTGPACGGRVASPVAGFSGQNLRIKYIPCVGTHL